MTKPVRLDDEADSEIDAAVAWYEMRLTGLGMELLAEIETAKQRLSDRPGTCSRVSGLTRGLEVRRSQVHRFPYALVFVELEDQVRVLALAHARRRPGYWRKRLAPTKKQRSGR